MIMTTKAGCAALFLSGACAGMALCNAAFALVAAVFFLAALLNMRRINTP